MNKRHVRTERLAFLGVELAAMVSSIERFIHFYLMDDTGMAGFSLLLFLCFAYILYAVVNDIKLL